MKILDENTLYKKFIRFEYEKKYFNLTYNNISIWEYSRMLIYIELQTRIKNLTPSLPTFNLLEKKQECEEIKAKYLNINDLKKTDIILMGNPRRILQKDNKYYDINTDFIPDILDNYKCLTIEDPFWALFPNFSISHNIPAATKNIIYLDPLEKEYFAKLYSEDFNNDRKQIHNIFSKILKDIEIEFGFNLNNVIELCENKILYFIFAMPTYLKFLRKTQPKLVMLFYHPHHSEYLMTMAAKMLNIPVIEIQHGIIGEFEPIWHKYYDQNFKPKYLADYIFGYSPTFINTNDMVLKNKIQYVGYPFLEKKVKEYKSLIFNKPKYNILIISQANLSDKLSKFTSKLASLLRNYPHYHIYYKLHPYELDKYFDNLKASNITVIRDLKKDIYYYQSICDIQIGVYSTAIYEGSRFNTSTIIIKNLMGWQESYKILKEMPGIYVVDKPEDALKVILSNPIKTPIKNLLWGEYSKNKYKKYVTQIIEAHWNTLT